MKKSTKSIKLYGLSEEKLNESKSLLIEQKYSNKFGVFKEILIGLFSV